LLTPRSSAISTRRISRLIPPRIIRCYRSRTCIDGVSGVRTMITRPSDDVPARIEPFKAGVSSEDPERVGEHDVVVVIPLPPRLHPLGRDNVRLLAGGRPRGRREVRPRGRPYELKRLGLMPSGIRTTQPMLESSGSAGGGVRRRSRWWTSSTCTMLASQPSTRSASQRRPCRLDPNSGGKIWAERESYASSDEQRAWPVSAPAPDDPAQTGGDDYEADLRRFCLNFCPTETI
jgi:hypothetical protein